MFYFDLYNSEWLKDTSLFQNLFETVEALTLSSDQLERVDPPVELGELRIAISAMQNGKSLGPDGFPTDFYNIL